MNGLLLILLALLQDVGAATGEPAAPRQAKGADVDLMNAVRGIAENVERLRQDRFGRPPVAIRAPDDIRRAAAEIRAYNVVPRDRLAARGRAWVDIGLGATGSPEAILLALATDLSDVAFDPTQNRLLVSPERLSVKDYFSEGELGPGSKILMATGVRPDEPLVSHVLVHARQRERAGGDWLEPFTDRLLARAAWAEGEANLVAVRYLFEGMAIADDVLLSGVNPGELLDGKLLPQALGQLGGAEAGLLRFVYLEGFATAIDRYRAGGWQALSLAMGRDRTTRDVLHSGRPAPAEFADPTAPAEGLRLADEDSLGEHGVMVLVSILTGKDNLALEASEGWHGDRLYRWERAGEQDGTTEWLTYWSSEEDAEDFDYAFGRTLDSRFPDRPLDTLSPGVREVVTPSRTYRIERSATRVRVLIRSGLAFRGQSS